MHRLKFAALAAVLAVTGCKGASALNPLGNNGLPGTGGTTNYNLATGTMKATVDGTAWTANYQTRATLANNALSITGISYNGDLSQQREITMAVINVTPGMTYTLSGPSDGHGGNAIAVLGGNKQWFSAPTGGSGSVTITTLNTTHVVGTFAFLGIGANGIANSTVTNGTFDIPF